MSSSLANPVKSFTVRGCPESCQPGKGLGEVCTPESMLSRYFIRRQGASLSEIPLLFVEKVNSTIAFTPPYIGK